MSTSPNIPTTNQASSGNLMSNHAPKTIVLDGVTYQLTPIVSVETHPLPAATLPALVNRYLYHRQYILRTTKTTLHSYSVTLRAFVSWVQQQQISGLIAAHWLDYYAHLQNRQLAPNTLRNHRNYLKRWADWLVENDHLLSNPLADVTPPSSPKNLPRRAAGYDCIIAMLAAARRSPTPARDYALLKFFQTSGCRVSDAGQLTWRKIDIGGRVAATIGKWNRHRWMLFDRPTAAALVTYRDTLPPHQRGKTDPVWRGKRGAMTNSGLYQVFKRLAGRAGVTDAGTWNPHAWRHHYARALDRGGMSLPVLQHLLGHQSLTTTQIYTQPDPDELRPIYDQFAAVFDSNQTAG